MSSISCWYHHFLSPSWFFSSQHFILARCSARMADVTFCGVSYGYRQYIQNVEYEINVLNQKAWRQPPNTKTKTNIISEFEKNKTIKPLLLIGKIYRFYK